MRTCALFPKSRGAVPPQAPTPSFSQLRPLVFLREALTSRCPSGFISLSCVFLCLLFYVRRPSPSPFLLHLFGLRCFGVFLVDPWRARTCAELIPPVIQINLARARRSIRFSLLRRKTRSCLQSEFFQEFGLIPGDDFLGIDL